jgi:hypothetical protein
VTGTFTAKELLFSLAWAPHSAHHFEESKRMLSDLFGAEDVTDALREYSRICLSPPGPGSPK